MFQSGALVVYFCSLWGLVLFFGALWVIGGNKRRLAQPLLFAVGVINFLGFI
jgi:hypothetical protein